MPEPGERRAHKSIPRDRRGRSAVGFALIDFPRQSSKFRDFNDLRGESPFFGNACELDCRGGWPILKLQNNVHARLPSSTTNRGDSNHIALLGAGGYVHATRRPAAHAECTPSSSADQVTAPARRTPLQHAAGTSHPLAPMRGYNSLDAGNDHAASPSSPWSTTIFEKEGRNRHDLGREELVAASGSGWRATANRIITSSSDGVVRWVSTRFTLDEVWAALSAHVIQLSRTA